MCSSNPNRLNFAVMTAPEGQWQLAESGLVKQNNDSNGNNNNNKNAFQLIMS